MPGPKSTKKGDHSIPLDREAERGSVDIMRLLITRIAGVNGLGRAYRTL